MDDWRKSFYSRRERQSRNGVSNTNGRTTMAMSSVSRTLSTVSNSRGNRYLHNKGKVATKSITRRLSFPKHDDSINLLNMDMVEKTIIKIPGRYELPSTPLTAVHIDKENKETLEYVSHKTLPKLQISSDNPMSGLNKRNMGLSEETLAYLTEIGIVKSKPSPLKPSVQIQQSPIKPLSAPKIVLDCHQNDNVTKTYNVKFGSSSEKNSTQFVDGFNLKEVCCRHSEARKDLISTQHKELEELELRRKELISRHHKEFEELEQRQDKELETIFCQTVEQRLPKEVPDYRIMTESNKNPSTPDNRLIQDCFVLTPHSGNWFVSEGANAASNITPDIDTNSTFEDLTLVGKPQFLETPATRQLVRQRILKGMESLLVL